MLQGASGDPPSIPRTTLIALCCPWQLLFQIPVPDVTRALPGELQSLRTGGTGASPLPSPSARELMGSKAGGRWEPGKALENCGVTPREAQPSSAAWAPKLPLRGERSPWHGQSPGECGDRDVPAPPPLGRDREHGPSCSPCPEHPESARALPLLLCFLLPFLICLPFLPFSFSPFSLSAL